MFHAYRPAPGAARTCTTLLVLLVLVLAALAAAGPAAGAPTEPTLTIDELRAMIAADSDGKVTGYFKTVLAGSTITQVPCNVLAIADGALWDNSPLILFEATGPDLERTGGIAAGMSGSPLFVDDGGSPKLVGAVSYGYYYTTNGLGLATPIELMAASEDRWLTGSAAPSPVATLVPPRAPVTMLPLRRPVRSGSLGTIRSIALVRAALPTRRAVPKASGVAAMSPLLAVEIGGLDPRSRAYRHLAASLRARGFDVYDAGGGGVDPTFETALVGGAAVGAVLGYGDYWIAAMGTVTYAHDDDVVAFGHPLESAGATELIMANCKVHGVWSSLLRPFKLMSLGKMRGAIVQDRSYGIMGIVGYTPELVVINGSATLQPDGTTATAQTLVPARYPYVDWIAGEVAWGTASMPVDVLVDGDPLAFSADTSLHVVVNDGIEDLELTRNNMQSSKWSVGRDGYSVLSTLLSNPNGTAPATLVAVDATATVRLETHSGHILDAQVAGPMHNGDNTVSVAIRRYGSIATETRDVTLTIPEGVSTRGRLVVGGGSGGWRMYGYDMSSNSLSTTATRTITPPPTVADLIAGINDWEQNNDIRVTFYPTKYDPDPDGDGVRIFPETVFHSTELLSGGLSKNTPDIYLSANSRVVRAGRRPLLRGFILAPGDPGNVQIYRVRSGTRILLGNATVQGDGGPIMFFYRGPRIRHATKFVAVWSGNEHYLPGSDGFVVKIRH